MFTQKTIEQALELSKARAKHSSIEKDFAKLIEEIEEFRYQLGEPIEETQALQEFNDVVISALGCLLQLFQPETIEDMEVMNQFLSEEYEYKNNRTLQRFESGFYK